MDHFPELRFYAFPACVAACVGGTWAVYRYALHDTLPEGTGVEVVWSGGNRPHRHTVTVDRWGNRGVDGIRDFPQPSVYPGDQVRLAPPAGESLQERLRELAEARAGQLAAIEEHRLVLRRAEAHDGADWAEYEMGTAAVAAMSELAGLMGTMPRAPETDLRELAAGARRQEEEWRDATQEFLHGQGLTLVYDAGGQTFRLLDGHGAERG